MKLNKIEAITPDEVKLFNPDFFPSLMVNTINRLLLMKYKKGWINIYDYEILDLAKKSPDFISVEKDMSEDVISKLMNIYGKRGWKVKRVYPYDECDLDKCFRFKPKLKWFRKLTIYLFNYNNTPYE